VTEALPRTNVYVDGFNLYYGALKGTPYKWLDLDALFRMLLPQHDIRRIRYFTALTQPRDNDPHIHVRQQAYLRALGTHPHVSVHLGTFRQGITRMKLAPPANGTAAVIKTEEKGSDVNLASYLLLDCFREDFQAAVVVSNDTDLVTPIQMVANEFGCPVGLLNPHPRPARDLLRATTFYKQIRPGALAAAQFPDRIGPITKPTGW
jgi:hypothetical protein